MKPLPESNDLEKQHGWLETSAMLHKVLGVLVAVFGSIFLIHAAMGVAILTGGIPTDASFPRSMGWIFLLLGGAAVTGAWVLGGFMWACAGWIRQRRRHFWILIVDGIASFLVTPLGTILGVATIMLISQPHIKAEFRDDVRSLEG